jgi:predicted GNAT superfamily acetyltransferase
MESKNKSAIIIRDLSNYDDLKKVEGVEREAWDLADRDVTPMTLAVALKESGAIWVGAFDGASLVGYSFGFLAMESDRLSVHSHELAVRPAYRNLDLGYKLKMAQRERALAIRVQGLRIEEMTWTFDPLQSKNAHLNFAKLGVVSDSYKVDFYGPETSSVLHRNSTDRLWVKWSLSSRRVRDRLQGKDNRNELLDALSTLQRLVQFNGEGKPARTDLAAALGRQRIAIEIPSEISLLEQKDPALAREWRLATRWAFSGALKNGFFVAEFCRTIRGNQGPGAYVLEKGALEDYVPEILHPPAA